MRVRVTMACQDCKRRNYNTMKNKRNDPERIELRKYCKWCGTVTVHKETK
jgi:large subunit ribosomal protein L33